MVDHHVALYGDDSNDGTSGSPKRSPQAGWNLLANGDRLIIHSGVYTGADFGNILIDISGGIVAQRTILADGPVVFDGIGTTSMGIRILLGAASGVSRVDIEGIHFKRFLSSGVFDTRTATSSHQTDSRLTRCRFSNLLSGIAVAAAQQNQSHGGSCSVTDCEFWNISNAAIQQIAAPTANTNPFYNFHVVGTTFCDVGKAFYNGSISSNLLRIQTWRANIALNIGSHVIEYVNSPNSPAAQAGLIPGSDSAMLENYYHNHAGKLLKTGNVTYDFNTLADLRAAYPLLESFSVDGDPELADPANGVLYPRAGSPINTPSFVERIGARGPAIVMSPAYHSHGSWTIVGSSPAMDGPGTGLVAIGTFDGGGADVISGVGTLLSQVLDFGGLRRIVANDIVLIERYPTNVIDADNDDVPNRPTIEIRSSLSPFVQGESDVDLPFTKVRRSSEIPEVLVARYFQFRLLFRADGVIA